MKEIAGIVTEGIKSGNEILIVIAIVAALVFNGKKIVEFFEWRKGIKVRDLTDAIKCEYITGLTMRHMEDALAKEHFKRATGIRLEKEFREALIKAHKKTGGEIDFDHFRRALPYISFKNQKLEIKISSFAWAGYWYNIIVGLLTCFFGALLGLSQLPFNGKIYICIL